ncbi:unnamed protein product [Closterium sp. Naga37s-1]|nr:unnamed protein product [Closterium sp. Naga37s-1]
MEADWELDSDNEGKRWSLGPAFDDAGQLSDDDLLTDLGSTAAIRGGDLLTDLNGTAIRDDDLTTSNLESTAVSGGFTSGVAGRDGQSSDASNGAGTNRTPQANGASNLNGSLDYNGNSESSDRPGNEEALRSAGGIDGGAVSLSAADEGRQFQLNFARANGLRDAGEQSVRVAAQLEVCAEQSGAGDVGGRREDTADGTHVAAVAPELAPHREEQSAESTGPSVSSLAPDLAPEETSAGGLANGSGEWVGKEPAEGVREANGATDADEGRRGQGKSGSEESSAVNRSGEIRVGEGQGRWGGAQGGVQGGAQGRVQGGALGGVRGTVGQSAERAVVAGKGSGRVGSPSGRRDAAPGTAGGKAGGRFEGADRAGVSGAAGRAGGSPLRRNGAAGGKAEERAGGVGGGRVVAGGNASANASARRRIAFGSSVSFNAAASSPVVAPTPAPCDPPLTAAGVPPGIYEGMQGVSPAVNSASSSSDPSPDVVNTTSTFTSAAAAAAAAGGGESNAAVAGSDRMGDTVSAVDRVGSVELEVGRDEGREEEREERTEEGREVDESVVEEREEDEGMTLQEIRGDKQAGTRDQDQVAEGWEKEEEEEGGKTDSLKTAERSTQAAEANDTVGGRDDTVGGRDDTVGGRDDTHIDLRSQRIRSLKAHTLHLHTHRVLAAHHKRPPSVLFSSSLLFSFPLPPHPHPSTPPYQRRVDLRSQRIRSLKADTLHLPPAAQVGLWQVLLRCCSGAAQVWGSGLTAAEAGAIDCVGFVYLRGNKLTAMDGIERLKKVKVLDVSYNQLGEASLAPLAACASLQVLDVSYNQLGEASLAPLAACASLQVSDSEAAVRRSCVR